MGAFGHPKEEADFDTQRVTRREEVFSLLERYLGKPTLSKPGEQSSRFQSLCSTLDLLQNLHFNESPLYPPPPPLLPAKGLIVNIQIGEALLLKSEQISMVAGFNCCHICLLILIICIFCWMLPFYYPWTFSEGLLNDPNLVSEGKKKIKTYICICFGSEWQNTGKCPQRPLW